MMKNNIKLSEIELNVRENGNFRFVSFFFIPCRKLERNRSARVFITSREEIR